MCANTAWSRAIRRYTLLSIVPRYSFYKYVDIPHGIEPKICANRMQDDAANDNIYFVLLYVTIFCYTVQKTVCCVYCIKNDTSILTLNIN